MRRTRGVSGIIGLIFLLAAFVIGMTLMILVMDTNLRIQAGQQSILSRFSNSISLEKSVRAEWKYDAGNKALYIDVTNGFTQPVMVNRILAVFQDGSFVVSNKRTTIIDPGESKTISMSGVKEKPSTVALSLSSGVVASSTVRASEKTAPLPTISYCYRNVTVENPLPTEINDYQLKITLNSSNTDFTETDPDMIYFTDSSGNPLYFWIESWNTTEKEAVVWIRIPSIPANSNITIRYYVSTPNPYQSYNDPEKVFYFYEDLEDYAVGAYWGIQYGSGKVVIDDSISYEGHKSAHKIENNDPNGAYKSLGEPLVRDKNILVEMRVNRNPSYTGGNYDRIGLIDNNGNGYGWFYAHGSSPSIGIDKRNNYSPTVISRQYVSENIVGEWVKGELYIFANGTVKSFLYGPDGTLLGITSKDDNQYSSFNNLYIFGGNDYWVDRIIVRQYLDNPPAYSFGPQECYQQGQVVSSAWYSIDTGKIFGDNTTLSIGRTYLYHLANLRSQINTLVINEGVISSGSPDSLYMVDGDKLSLLPSRKYIILLDQRRTLYWDNFSSNPIGARIIPSTGTWSYNTNGYISETSKSGSGNSDEDYAYINNITSINDKTYVLVKMKPNDNGWHDIILSEGTSNDDPFYELSLNAPSSVEIWKYESGWSRLNSTGCNINTGEWHLALGLYIPSSYLRESFLADNGTLVCYTEARDSSINPSRIGIGNWRDATTDFDYIYVVKDSDPRYVYVTGVPSSYSVVIYFGSDTFTGTYNSTINGFTVPIYPQSSFFTPVLNNANLSIYDDASRLVASFNGTIMGGDIYVMKDLYLIDYEVVTNTTLENIDSYNKLTLEYESDVSEYDVDIPRITIYAYNYSSGGYVKLYTSAESDISENISLSSDFVNSTGYSMIRINAQAEGNYTINFDVVNTIDNVTLYELKNTGIIGYNDTLYIYELDIEYPLRASLLYSLKTPEDGIGWIGDVAMTLRYAAIYINNKGVYVSKLASQPNWTLIEDTCTTTSGLRPRIAGISENKLIVLYGEASYCLLYDNGSVIHSGSLPSNVVYESVYYDYLPIAVDGGDIYTIALNQSDGNYYLAKYSSDTDEWRLIALVPGVKATGMSYYDGYVYLFLENGGFYKISIDDGSIESFTPPPFYPQGPGERMDYYANKLWFLRNDYTSELWVYVFS